MQVLNRADTTRASAFIHRIPISAAVVNTQLYRMKKCLLHVESNQKVLMPGTGAPRMYLSKLLTEGEGVEKKKPAHTP